MLYNTNNPFDFNFNKNWVFVDEYSFSIDPVWNLTTVEEGYTYVASEGAAKLPRLSSTR